MFGYLADLRAQFDARASEFDSHADELLEGGGSDSASSSSPQQHWASGGALNMSPLTNAVMWLHQVTAKVKQTALIVVRVLPGVPGMDKFQAEAKEIEARMSEAAKNVRVRKNALPCWNCTVVCFFVAVGSHLLLHHPAIGVQCFSRWLVDAESRLNDPSSALALQTRGALIEFDTVDGQVRLRSMFT
jgi:hypothetical protein